MVDSLAAGLLARIHWFFTSQRVRVSFSLMWLSYKGCMEDALASRGEEGRGRLRKAPGSGQTRFDPEMSEWGNPTSLGNQKVSLSGECIARQSQRRELKHLSTYRKGNQPRLR